MTEYEVGDTLILVRIDDRLPHYIRGNKADGIPMGEREVGSKCVIIDVADENRQRREGKMYVAQYLDGIKVYYWQSEFEEYFEKV